MNMDELLDFCQKNGVGVYIRYDKYTNALRVRLQSDDFYQCETIIQRECCEAIPDKGEHFQWVLQNLMEQINKYKTEHRRSQE